MEDLVSVARRERLRRRLNTVETALVALGLAAVGALMLFFGGRDSLWTAHTGLQALVNALGGTLIAAIALGLLWELAGKRSFAQEILEQARISTDVDAAGLVRIGTNYVEDPDWDVYFANVMRLDIVVAYARTWRNQHLARLRAMAARSGARIHVYLPDPEDTIAIAALAAKFGSTPEQLGTNIEETRQEFLALTVPGGAEIKVFYRPGYSVFSFYRLDSVAVLTLYSHSRERQSGIPTMVCRAGGSLFEFVYGELRVLRSMSHDAPAGADSEGSTS